MHTDRHTDTGSNSHMVVLGGGVLFKVRDVWFVWCWGGQAAAVVS